MTTKTVTATETKKTDWQLMMIRRGFKKPGKLNLENEVRLSELRTTRPSQGIWLPSSFILEEDNSRLIKAKVDLKKLKWIGPPEPPTRTKGIQRDEVWVLETSLGSLQKTFDFYMKWLLSSHVKTDVWNKMKSTPNHMRLINEQKFQPLIRRWRLLKMNSAHGASLQKVTNSKRAKNIAGIDALAALAQNPERVRKMDGKKWSFVNLGAIRLCAPGYDDWKISPDVDYNQTTKRLFVAFCDITTPFAKWSTPLRK